MNPIQQFETTALQIWQSTADASEKAIRLRALAKGIQNYVTRISKRPSDAKSPDLYVKRARERVIKYLGMLAEDIESLAVAAQKAAVAPKAMITTRPSARAH